MMKIKMKKKVKQGNADKGKLLPMEVEYDELEDAKTAPELVKDKRRRTLAADVAQLEKIDYVELMRYIENTHPTVELDDKAIEGKVKRGLLHEDEPEIAFHAFPLCGKLGTLRPAMACCPMETTEMAK